MFIYVPVDIDPTLPRWDILNQYEDLVTTAKNAPEADGEEDNNNNNGFGRGGRVGGRGGGRRRNDDDDGDFTDFHVKNGWMEVMSYSHNVAAQPSSKNYAPAHIGELTTTFFSGINSITLQGLVVGQETIPYIIFRMINRDNNTFIVTEYLFEHARISNLSTSGGQGGRPVQTMSVTGMIFTLRHFEFTSEGVVSANVFSSYDRVKDISERTRTNKHVKSLLDIANEKVIEKNLSEQEKNHLKSLQKTSSEYTWAKKGDKPVIHNIEGDEREEESELEIN